MTKEIKYIGFYDLPDSKNKRVSNLAATSKMDYISDALIEAGYKVHLISPSWLSDEANNIRCQAKKIIQISKNKRITFCPSFGTRKKWTRKLKIIFTLGWLFLWLLKNTMKNEKVLVYHVQWLSLPIRLAKKIKGFKLVLEVEEIYGKVWENKQVLNHWENKLIQSADYYFAASDILAAFLGKKTKVVIYGNYATPKYKDIHSLPPRAINVIYAGSIDKTKGGAFNTVRCSQFLSDNHIVHICGGGRDEDLKTLNELIVSTNSVMKREACIYHGIKTGKEFEALMLSCQIGINPQKQGDYMETAFPSKVISYLAHSLAIISAPIKSVVMSMVAHYIIFSDSDEPYELAIAVQSVRESSVRNSSAQIQSLNNIFIGVLKELFG